LASFPRSDESLFPRCLFFEFRRCPLRPPYPALFWACAANGPSRTPPFSPVVHQTPPLRPPRLPAACAVFVFYPRSNDPLIDVHPFCGHSSPRYHEFISTITETPFYPPPTFWNIIFYMCTIITFGFSKRSPSTHPVASIASSRMHLGRYFQASKGAPKTYDLPINQCV